MIIARVEPELMVILVKMVIMVMVVMVVIITYGGNVR